MNLSTGSDSDQSSLDASGRVRIWNTFFKLAWAEAKLLFETTSGCTSQDEFDPDGGTLAEEEFHTLATLALCTLAIEARTNHLVDELVEKGRLSEQDAKEAKWLPVEDRWFAVPRLAGMSEELDDDKGSHQAIKEICALRNDLMHVDYAGLRKKLPKPGVMLSNFQRFVEAMEDMNVVLGRVDGPRRSVLTIGTFKRESLGE